ncbi:hypothetical protein L2Y94_06905 [Luteibacter aegosomatis]|uniref:hypothetical protein n=1 Tax=Luteibacter aegosomatis TaxID=2911537 RepID=UPI001FF7CB09|nr:hypothetical protein [Luteibacter aegosomatis]UPG87074.1 hypothetical protein L2Y94_06905 [Luteibacter aegosomatis]
MIPADGKEKYVTAYSHKKLAKEWGVTLLALDEYALEHGWDREHRLHWSDVAMQALKEGVEERNLVAVKEMLRVTGKTRPVGRPSKLEVQKHLAIEARIASEFDEDIARLKTDASRH